MAEAEEKIGLSVEDVADINMSYGLFDDNDQGQIDLESLEAALGQICQGEDGNTILPAI